MTTSELAKPKGLDADLSQVRVGTAQVLKLARDGKPIILIRNWEAGAEGILSLPGQCVTPDRINFMARHAGGIICLGLREERIRALGIPDMPVREGGTVQPHAASIEARLGVTTGISAADRAQTVQVAINPDSKPDDLVSPGHVFPCTTKPGGVLVRPDYAEGAVDIAALAGFDPSAVICKILNEEGSTAQLSELVEFALLHGLKIGAISDLVRHRQRTESLIEPLSSEAFISEFGGEWQLNRYQDRIAGQEIWGLTYGQINPDHSLVRIHNFNLLDDALGRVGHQDYSIAMAMSHIAAEGSGIMVIFEGTPGKAQTGSSSHGWEQGLAQQVLKHLGAGKITCLSSNQSLEGLDLSGTGLEIIGYR